MYANIGRRFRLAPRDARLPPSWRLADSGAKREDAGLSGIGGPHPASSRAIPLIPPYPAYPAFIGSFRTGFPVSARIALHTAGAMQGVPGSPMPPCASPAFRMYVSIRGVSRIRSTR